MTPIGLVEAAIEHAALEWFSQLGYAVLHGPSIAPGELLAERTDYGQPVLEGRLKDALMALNPDVPAEALDDAFRRLTRSDSPDLLINNRAFHRLLLDGVPVSFQRPDGSTATIPVRVVNFDDPEANDWLAVHQYTVVENRQNRRADIVLFVNGLPLAVIELKNAADEQATVEGAFHQLQTYKAQIPSLFVYNEALVISDGLKARIGTLSADRERFMPWRTIEGDQTAPTTALELEVMIKGVFERRRFLNMVRFCTVFEDEGRGAVKKMAGYHQFHAVNVAVAETVRATRPAGHPGTVGEVGQSWARPRPGGEVGDQRAGVVWHTQGSGKSLTMAFYAGWIVQHPKMENPTLVVITDRNDLDDQLFGTFSRCHDLLRQTPVQAENRTHLRDLLRVASGGVVFTTIQKFFPEDGSNSASLLSDRRNIVVIADEAHRSQYDFIDGFARHMRDALPNASFIGFTGTPIEKADKNTRAVFGDYIRLRHPAGG